MGRWLPDIHKHETLIPLIYRMVSLWLKEYYGHNNIWFLLFVLLDCKLYSSPCCWVSVLCDSVLYIFLFCVYGNTVRWRDVTIIHFQHSSRSEGDREEKATIIKLHRTSFPCEQPLSLFRFPLLAAKMKCVWNKESESPKSLSSTKSCSNKLFNFCLCMSNGWSPSIENKVSIKQPENKKLRNPTGNEIWFLYKINYMCSFSFQHCCFTAWISVPLEFIK